MKDRIHAIAELRWVTEDEGFSPSPIRARWLASPAEFECDPERLWSVFVVLEAPVYPGDVTVGLVTTVVEGAAGRLLFLGSEFRWRLDGSHTLALGRVLSVERVSEEEHRRRTAPPEVP